MSIILHFWTEDFLPNDILASVMLKDSDKVVEILMEEPFELVDYKVPEIVEDAV